MDESFSLSQNPALRLQRSRALDRLLESPSGILFLASTDVMPLEALAIEAQGIGVTDEVVRPTDTIPALSLERLLLRRGEPTGLLAVVLDAPAWGLEQREALRRCIDFRIVKPGPRAYRLIVRLETGGLDDIPVLWLQRAVCWQPTDCPTS